MSNVNVVIIGGSGGVGASVTFNLLLRGEPYDVVLVDLKPNIIASHVMDLEHALDTDMILLVNPLSLSVTQLELRLGLQ